MRLVAMSVSYRVAGYKRWERINIVELRVILKGEKCNCFSHRRYLRILYHGKMDLLGTAVHAHTYAHMLADTRDYIMLTAFHCRVEMKSVKAGRVSKGEMAGAARFRKYSAGRCNVKLQDGKWILSTTTVLAIMLTNLVECTRKVAHLLYAQYLHCELYGTEVIMGERLPYIGMHARRACRTVCQTRLNKARRASSLRTDFPAAAVRFGECWGRWQTIPGLHINVSEKGGKQG